MRKRLRFSPSALTRRQGQRYLAIALLLGPTLTLLSTTTLRGQKLTHVGPPSSVNGGKANLCKPGQNGPAPCSTTVAIEYKVDAGGTLGIPEVVTEGSPNLDYTLSNGTTCVAA